MRNGWSRGDIFKFANTTHLDVRHFSVAKENHQIKQPTFPLGFCQRDFFKINLAAGSGIGSFASLGDREQGRCVIGVRERSHGRRWAVGCLAWRERDTPVGHAYSVSPASQEASLCSSRRPCHHTEGQKHPFAIRAVAS